MIWCRFQNGSKASYGIVEGDVITEVEGDPFAGYTATTKTHPVGSTKLLIPTMPQTFFAAGVNYKEHVLKMAALRVVEPKFPEKPDIGYRAQGALIAHDEDIIKPKDSTEKFQYEGELVAVFGKKCRNVSKEEALDYVLGWTIGNDVSERTWQKDDRTLWRAKNSDTFKPMGPWIVTGLDYTKMTTTVKINGQVTEQFATGGMIFDPPTFISTVSKYITIQPGDVMWMGTDGVPPNMKPGDVCEVEISGIGTLRNRIVAEA